MIGSGITGGNDRAADGAQAIRRALLIVRTVAQLQRSGATLSRVTGATGLNRSTVHRLLRALTDERLLRFREGDRSYHLGPLAFELGLAAASSHDDVRDGWRRVIDDVARRTRLTSYLMARSDDEAVCLLCTQGTTAVRAMPVEVGQRVPLGVGAGSLVMLAALDDDEIRRIEAARHQAPRPPSSATVAAPLFERIAATRRRGFSISRGTVAAGVSGVGVLIADPARRGQMAVTVSAVTDDINEREAATLAAIIRDSVRAHGIYP
jgi:DNA-binding IclR family transcriptional regulator